MVEKPYHAGMAISGQSFVIECPKCTLSKHMVSGFRNSNGSKENN